MRLALSFRRERIPAALRHPGLGVEFSRQVVRAERDFAPDGAVAINHGAGQWQRGPHLSIDCDIAPAGRKADAFARPLMVDLKLQQWTVALEAPPFGDGV